MIVFAFFIKLGFRKSDPEQWEFANDDFVKGQPHLLKNIHRRKPVHSHSLTNLHGHVNSIPLTDSERQKYRDDIERLRQERKLLLRESQKQKQEEQGLESQIQLLSNRLQQLEHRQDSFALHFAWIMQKPELALMPPLENLGRKRRVSSRPDHFHDDLNNEDSMGTFRTSRRGSPDYASGLEFDTDLLDRIESNLAFWETVVEDIDTLCDTENSYLEFAEPTTCAESPALSYSQVSVEDPSCDPPRMDMNSKPSATALVVAPDPGLRTDKEAVAQRVNDIFWEQLLTENPGSSDVQEVQTERKDPAVREKDSRLTDHGRYWLGLQKS